MKFNELAEYQIKKAQMEGVFDNLKGAGKPLGGGYDLNLAAHVSASCNVIPHEFEIKKKIEELISTLSVTPNKELESQLKKLERQFEIEHEAALNFFARD